MVRTAVSDWLSLVRPQ